MHVDKRSSRWPAIWVYAGCLMGCGALLALAGVAFSISTDLVGTAAAQAEQRWSGIRPSVLAALPSVDDNVQKLFPASKRPAAALPRSVVPVLISRVPAEGGAAVGSTAAGVEEAAEEAISPDIDEWANYEPWTPDRNDTYRTVCVRLCDGASFPISFATTRERFKADAAKCKSSCGSPAKLFVSRPDGSADDLVDVRGRLYADLPNAFKYRTSYDAACTCKAQPWDVAELERHRHLAEAARINPQLGALGAKAADRPAALPDSDAQVEIAAIRSNQTPRDVMIATGSVRPPKAQVLAAAPEPSVRRGAARSPPALSPAVHSNSVRSPAGRAVPQALPTKVAAGSTKVVTSKVSVTGKKRVIGEAAIAATVSPRVTGRTKIAHLDASSMQRPFRAKEYWRLSYWESPNF